MSILFLLGCRIHIWNAGAHSHTVPCAGTSQAGKQSAYEISPWEDLIVKGSYAHMLQTDAHTGVCYGYTASPWSELSFPFSWPKQFGFHLRVSVLPAANKCNRTVKHSERQKKKGKKINRFFFEWGLHGWWGVVGCKGRGLRCNLNQKMESQGPLFSHPYVNAAGRKWALNLFLLCLT